MARDEPAGLPVERQECASEWASVCAAPADRGATGLREPELIGSAPRAARRPVAAGDVLQSGLWTDVEPAVNNHLLM